MGKSIWKPFKRFTDPLSHRHHLAEARCAMRVRQRTSKLNSPDSRTTSVVKKKAPSRNYRRTNFFNSLEWVIISLPKLTEPTDAAAATPLIKAPDCHNIGRLYR
jgi:hypothetical protein